MAGAISATKFGVFLTDQEHGVLQDLLWDGYPFAYILYLQEIRWHMDGATNIVGDKRVICEQGMRETIERDTKPGRYGAKKVRSRQFIQRQISALEKYGLIERLPKPHKTAPMRFYLPLADAGSIRAQEVRTKNRTILRAIESEKVIDISKACNNKKIIENNNSNKEANYISLLEEEEGAKPFTVDQLASVDLAMVVELYHRILDKLPRVLRWDVPAYRLMLARVWFMDDFHQTQTFWEKYFLLVKNNAFLRGQVPSSRGRPFQANFKFLIDSATVIKVLNGEYV